MARANPAGGGARELLLLLAGGWMGVDAVSMEGSKRWGVRWDGERARGV